MNNIEVGDRIIAVNQALQLFAPNTRIEKRGNGGHNVIWTDRRGKTHKRRYAVYPRTNYWPAFHDAWGHGGTYAQCLGMLMRWVQFTPVWPLRVWQNSGFVKNNSAIADILESAGWPTDVTCIKCGKRITDRFDWYSLDKISGPGHFWDECPATKGEYP